jgi:hypothetical protein
MKPNWPLLKELISSTEKPDNWKYEDVLQLTSAVIHEAPYDMIIDNPDDVANGVSRVQVVFNCRFFDLFGSLIIKHHSDGSIMLVFNDFVSDVDLILQFYQELVLLLGAGYNDDERSKSFDERNKVESIARGAFQDEEDLVGHAWTRSQFGFSLSYRTEPSQQFVFSITWSPEKQLSYLPRKNGTLIDILLHDPHIIIHGQELSASTVYDNGEVKFIDYTFQLDPPELNVFDRVRIRVFGQEKSLLTGQYHIAYYSRFEVNTADAIALCDQLVKIYGADSHNGMEIEPYEVRMLDARIQWTGRSWWINEDHGIKNFDNPDENILYWVSLTQVPDEDGFSLHITGFNTLYEYHLKTVNK